MHPPAKTAPESLAPMIGSAAFQRLPAGERLRLATLIPVLERLERARPAGAALARAAADLAHLPWASSPKTLERHLALWRRHRDWRLHADRRADKRLQAPAAGDAALRSPEFLSHWRGLCEDNGRATAPALRELKRRWKAGYPVPGYGTWREWWAARRPGASVPTTCPGYPAGWSDRNLRRLGPTAAQIALARGGFKKLAEVSAYAPRTTRHLRASELLVADDLRLDVMAMLPRAVTIAGRTYPAGPTAVVGMVLMDVGSRKIIGWCLRPAAKDEDGVRAVMGREDLAMLTATALLEHGLPEGWPVEFYTERATATFTAEVRGWMAAQFGDRVRFRSTGVFDAALAEYGYREGGGKPWHKGWIEALFPLMHNELAALPGQIGARYDLAPGNHGDRLRAANALLKAAERLSDRAADRLRWPFPTYAEICEKFGMIVDRLNARTDHRLEGFDRVMRWRPDAAQPWREDPEALALLPREAALAAQCETRPQSPAERWAALRAAGRFAAVDMSAVAPLLSKAEAVTVRRGMIRIERDGETHHFRGEATAHDGARWLAHWSWLYPDAIHLYAEGSLAYVGAAPRLERTDVMDRAALGEAGRAMRRDTDALAAGWRARHADAEAAARADREHNAAVLRGDREPGRVAERLREIEPAAPATRRPRVARDITEL